MSSLKIGFTRLVVILVRVTNYDEWGYPLRFWRGVLPSNSLAAMYALTKQALEMKIIPAAEYVIKVFDDGVIGQKVSDPARLVKQYDDGATKVIAGLVGVQTNQFPRARDLAYRFKEAGAEVVIGGFHVSGSVNTMLKGIAAIDSDKKRSDVPCPHVMPPEVEELMANGVIVCLNEAEKIWGQILTDIWRGQAQKLYDGGNPSIENAPIPEYPENYFEDFATNIGTLDANRGCPFACNFCTIINVQGRIQRFRDPQRIIEMVRRSCLQYERFHGFFTDDNFARNPAWRQLLEGLAALRQQNYKISFMIEADLASFRLDGFIAKLAQAGCTQIFLGMESLNQKVLKDAKKYQNQVENFPRMIEALHRHGIAVHVGFIIGWPAETRESVLRDIENLKKLGVDQVSLFILTPLPGSELHIRMYCEGVPMDPDLNWYDSFHAVCDHPNLSRTALRQLMFDGFREFYRSSQMAAALKRLPEKMFWNMMRIFFWYRNSSLGEKVHPMNCGFWSVRNRRERRPGLAKKSFVSFWGRELWSRTKYLAHCVREFYIFEHVYFEARLKDEITDQWSAGADKARGCWSHCCDFWRYVWRQPSRRWLNSFWRRYGANKWRLFWRLDWHLLALPHAAAEIIYTWYFGLALVRNLKTMAT